MTPEQNILLTERIGRTWQKFTDWVWQLQKPDDTILLRFLQRVLRVIFIVAREFQDDRIYFLICSNAS